jgi:hypothetical protein
LCDGVILLGGTDIVSGYPLSGAYGEKVAELKVKFASGKESCYPLRNGIEITTAFATYRSSRIDPRASGAERFMEFSYNGSFERYVMNKTVFEFDTAEKVESAELIGTDGHIVLTYALLGFKK